MDSTGLDEFSRDSASADMRRMLWGLTSPADPLPEDILGGIVSELGLKGEEWEFARCKVGKKYTKAWKGLVQKWTCILQKTEKE